VLACIFGVFQKSQEWVHWDTSFSVLITYTFVTKNSVKKIQELIKARFSTAPVQKRIYKMELRTTHSVVALSLHVNIKMFSISTVLLKSCFL